MVFVPPRTRRMSAHSNSQLAVKNRLRVNKVRFYQDRPLALKLVEQRRHEVPSQ